MELPKRLKRDLVGRAAVVLAVADVEQIEALEDAVVQGLEARLTDRAVQLRRQRRRRDAGAR